MCMKVMCYATCSHWDRWSTNTSHRIIFSSIPGAGQAENVHSVLRCSQQNRLVMSRRLGNSQSTFLSHTSTQGYCAYNFDLFSHQRSLGNQTLTLLLQHERAVCFQVTKTFSQSTRRSQTLNSSARVLQIGKPLSSELATTLCDERSRRQIRSADATNSFPGTVAANTAETGERYSITGTGVAQVTAGGVDALNQRTGQPAVRPIPSVHADVSIEGTATSEESGQECRHVGGSNQILTSSSRTAREMLLSRGAFGCTTACVSSSGSRSNCVAGSISSGTLTTCSAVRCPALGAASSGTLTTCSAVSGAALFWVSVPCSTSAVETHI